MELGETLYVVDRGQWRAWLSEHHATAREIWVVFYKKHTGKASIAYNDAVEEALCFGWIDSIVKTVDDSSYAQRFTPRKSRSRWSEANKERVRRLVAQGKMAPAGLEAASDVVAALKTSSEGEPGTGDLVIAADILEALQRDETTWRNFQAFPQTYKRIRIGWIEGARNRPHLFEQRLRYFLRMTAKNDRYGMVQ